MPVISPKLDALGIDWVCEQVAECSSITAIAKSAGVSKATLIAWIHSDADRSMRAREVRSWTAQAWDEEAEYAIINADDPLAFQKANALASHYRWRASKIAPRIYGDKLQVEQDTTLHITVRRDDLETVDEVIADATKSIANNPSATLVFTGREGGVLAAGGSGVKGNPTSTATSGQEYGATPCLPSGQSSGQEVVEKPKKKRKSKGNWIHGGGVMLTAEEMEKDTE